MNDHIRIESHKGILRTARRGGIDEDKVAVAMDWSNEYLRQLQRDLAIEDEDRDLSGQKY